MTEVRLYRVDGLSPRFHRLCESPGHHMSQAVIWQGEEEANTGRVCRMPRAVLGAFLSLVFTAALGVGITSPGDK